MKLRRYCVTVSDNWTPTRYFWRRRSAIRWMVKMGSVANFYVWQDGIWRKPYTTATTTSILIQY